ncbi:hypothetical protein B9G55_12290 [Saccharibacillus sp. O16]|nr:hypothetical protein B9G55_12290 [Saccharibacillus sp. O16]
MRKVVIPALIFSFFATLLDALVFGEKLAIITYIVIWGLLFPISCMFAIYVSQRQHQLENETLTVLSTTLSAAATTQEIDSILLAEVNHLIPASSEVGILELKPFSDEIALRNGVCSEPQSMTWLIFEKETDVLIELRDSLFIRLCSRGGRTLFLVVKKKAHFSFRFQLKHQRILALRAVARTAYEKQFLVEGLSGELEDLLSQSPHASSKISRLAFELGERERSRLALDLHDTALQDQLFWHRYILELLENDQLSAYTKSELRLVSEGMLDVVFRLREICTELKPRIESTNVLHNQAEAVASAFDELIQKARLRSDFEVTFDVTGFHTDLMRGELLILYRIVQELLNNATKHSKATYVHFTLESNNGLVFLRYCDDGIGVELQDSRKSYSGMGLSGIQERSNSLAGTSSFESSPGQGFRFELHFRPSKSISSST